MLEAHANQWQLTSRRVNLQLPAFAPKVLLPGSFLSPVRLLCCFLFYFSSRLKLRGRIALPSPNSNQPKSYVRRHRIPPTAGQLLLLRAAFLAAAEYLLKRGPRVSPFDSMFLFSFPCFPISRVVPRSKVSRFARVRQFKRIVRVRTYGRSFFGLLHSEGEIWWWCFVGLCCPVACVDSLVTLKFSFEPFCLGVVSLRTIFRCLNLTLNRIARKAAQEIEIKMLKNFRHGDALVFGTLSSACKLLCWLFLKCNSKCFVLFHKQKRLMIGWLCFNASSVLCQ